MSTVTISETIPAKTLSSPPALSALLELAIRHGLTNEDALGIVAAAWTTANVGEHQRAGEMLHDILNPTANLFNAVEFKNIARRPALGIHMGDPKAVTKCPFGRGYVGINANETDPQVLAERTSAEWSINQKWTKQRDTVIVYKRGEPVAIYRNVEWDRSPDLQPNGESRDNKGRFFIRAADVTFFKAGETYALDYAQDEQGFWRPILTHGRPWDTADPVLSYAANRPRRRKAVRQPVDLLDTDR